MAESVVKRNIVKIDLDSGNIRRSWINHSIGLSDNLGDAFGVELYRAGVPVNLGGATIMGYFHDPWGNNIVINGGDITYNLAVIYLPQACYNHEGQFTLALKIITDRETSSMVIFDGMIDNTNTGSAVAPTGTVPTYQEVLAVYDQMLEAKAGSVRFDIVQSLTDAQKLQAQNNMGAYYQPQIDTVNGKIGNTALPTTAQTLTGAIAEHETDITEINTEIGNTALPTTAQTLTGAIAEHEGDLTNQQGQITDLKSELNDINVTSLFALPEVAGSPNEAGTALQNLTTGSSVILPVKSGDVIRVTGINSASILVFIKSYSGTTLVPSGASGYTATKYVYASERTFTVPSDVNYVVISKTTNGNSRLPTKFDVNGYDFAKQANRNLFEIIKEINDNKSEAKNYTDSLTNAITDFLGTSKYEISGAYTDSDGTIKTNSSYKLVCFEVAPDNYVNAFGTYDRYAFYASRPVIGSTSYDQSVHSSSSIVNLAVPAGCNWIAIRTSPSNDNVTIAPASKLIINSGVTITADNKASYFTDCNNAPDNSMYNIRGAAHIENTPYGQGIVSPLITYDGTVRSITGYPSGVLYTYCFGITKQQLFLMDRNNGTDVILFFRSKFNVSASWSEWRSASSASNLTSSNIAIMKKMIAPYLDSEGHPTAEDTGITNPEYIENDPLIFNDFDNAPKNSIYQIDLDCDASVMAHNPSPGKSSILITMNFAYAIKHGEIQFCIGVNDIFYWRYGYQNTAESYVFTQWKRVLNNEDYSTVIANKGKLTSGSDLNSITGNCVYLCGDNEGNLHMPQNVDGFVTTKTVGIIRYQTFEVLSSAVRYTRYAVGDTWSEWVTV